MTVLSSMQVFIEQVLLDTSRQATQDTYYGFEAPVKDQITAYIWAHVADESCHVSCFDFVDEPALVKRLGEELISTRYIYKFLEGVEANDWLLRAQIRLQGMSYASIYEAVIHHVLFDRLLTQPSVIALTEFPRKKQVSIPNASLALLHKHLEHDGKQIILAYEAVGKTDESKVRFDKKAECASSLGLIEEWLKDELIKFYEA